MARTKKVKPMQFRFIFLVDGKSINGAEFDDAAPTLPGFLALKCNMTAEPTTQYIALNAITGMIIDKDVLENYSPAYFMGGSLTNVKVKD